MSKPKKPVRRSLRSSAEGDVIMDINTTPLIDVMLVLLVMLIITIPIQLHAVNMDLPVGTPPQNLAKPEEISLEIDAQSQLYWQGQLMNLAEMEQRMTSTAALDPQPVVKIRPDKAARYAVFARVLASTKRQGLSKIAVIGAEQFVP